MQTAFYSINVLIVGPEGQFITRFSRQIKPKQVVRRTNDNVEILDYSDDVIRATKKTINDDKVAAWIKQSKNSKTDLAGYLNDPKHIDFKNKVNQLDNPDAFCETLRNWKRDKIHSFHQFNNGLVFWEELYKVNPNIEWLSDFNTIYQICTKGTKTDYFICLCDVLKQTSKYQNSFKFMDKIVEAKLNKWDIKYDFASDFWTNSEKELISIIENTENLTEMELRELVGDFRHFDSFTKASDFDNIFSRVRDNKLVESLKKDAYKLYIKGKPNKWIKAFIAGYYRERCAYKMMFHLKKNIMPESDIKEYETLESYLLSFKVQDGCIRTGLCDMIPSIKFIRLYQCFICLNFDADCVFANSPFEVDFSELLNSKFDFSEFNAIYKCLINSLNTNGNFRLSLMKQINKDIFMDDDFTRPFLEPIYNRLMDISETVIQSIKNDIINK